MSLSRSQDNTCFQNSRDSLQEKSRCSMDSSSFWQKLYMKRKKVAREKDRENEKENSKKRVRNRQSQSVQILAHAHAPN